jgi:hypothetical protein
MVCTVSDDKNYFANAQSTVMAISSETEAALAAGILI